MTLEFQSVQGRVKSSSISSQALVDTVAEEAGINSK
jgi:hypothetical protein